MIIAVMAGFPAVVAEINGQERAAPIEAQVPGDDGQRRTITNSVGMRLVEIPAGEFLMGNADDPRKLAKAFPAIEKRRIDELTDEVPLHKVRITRPFYIGAHEVTIAQFKKFIDDAGYQTEAERDGTGGWGYNRLNNYFVGRKR
jgi:formylglycine-generating enzyme required for sulfatase activity